MKISLDNYDKVILDELTKNARISHSELATRVHLSRNAVRQRVERLEKDGVIAAYTIVQGDTSNSAVVAMMFIYRNDRMRGTGILKTLRSFSEVKTCDVMSGEVDIVVRLEASSADRIREIWDIVASSPEVKDTVTSFALSVHR